jgi:hypothetical protein
MNAVPEPSSLVLLTSLFLGSGSYWLRKRREAARSPGENHANNTRA